MLYNEQVAYFAYMKGLLADKKENPLKVFIAIAGFMLLIAAYFNPTISRFLPHWPNSAAAVGGHSASHVIGPADFTNSLSWSDASGALDGAITQMVFDDAGQVAYAVRGSFVYRCDETSGCDEPGDWTTIYLVPGTLDFLSLALDTTNQVLYAGDGNASGTIWRCDIVATSCDAGADWTITLTSTAQTPNAVIVAGGVVFAGIRIDNFSSKIYRCDIAGTGGCQNPGDWTDISSGGTINPQVEEFGFDEGDNVLYGGFGGSSEGTVYRCDMATGCDDDTEWISVFSAGGPFTAFTVDEVNGVVYAAQQHGVDDFDPDHGSVRRCDERNTDCSGPDWTAVTPATNDFGKAIFWDAGMNVIFWDIGGQLYRCDVAATDCDAPGDWRVVFTDATGISFARDPSNSILYLGGNHIFRCEESSGCDSPSELENPNDVARDIAGNRLFVADTDHNRVLVYDTSGGVVDGQDPVNVLGQTDFSNTNPNQGGAESSSTLYSPINLAYDPVGQRLFVSDFNNNRILIYDLSGAITDGMAASFELGQANDGDPFDSAVFPNPPTAASFNAVQGMVYDTDNSRLFVADRDNNRVLVFNLNDGITNGEDAINELGQDDGNADLNFFNDNVLATNQHAMWHPTSVTYDSDGSRLFVADTGADRVLVFDVSGISNGENAINELGQPDFDTSGGQTTQSGMNDPFGVSYDPTTTQLYVSEQNNNRILVFDVAAITDGEDAVDVFGQDDFTTGSSGTTQNTFFGPLGIGIEGGNELWVADAQNNRILFFDLSPLPTPTPATPGSHVATDVLGQIDNANTPFFTSFQTNNLPSARQFGGGAKMAVDTVHHRLFATDDNYSRVLVFNLDVNNQLLDRIADHVLGQANFKTQTSGTTATKFIGPLAVAYDGVADRLFLLDGNNFRVLVFDTASIANGEAAVHVLGQVDFTSAVNGPPTQTLIGANAFSIAFDGVHNRLFVSNTNDHRVMVFDVASITDNEPAINVIGQTDFTSGSDGGLNQHGLGGPVGLAYDNTSDRLFVADQNTDRNRIMVFDVDPSVLIPNTPSADGPDAINVIGQSDFTSNGTALSRNKVFVIRDATIDISGQRLFVSDEGDDTHNRIMVFDVNPAVLIANTPATDGPDAINVIGQTDYTSGAHGLSQSTFNFPSGLGYDASNDFLYVGDSGNTRQLVFNVSPVVLIANNATTDGPNAVDLLGVLDNNDQPVYDYDGFFSSNPQGFGEPDYMALDYIHHRIFVSDYDNSRVLVFNANSDMSPTDHTADFVIGQANFQANLPQTNRSGLSGPEGVTYDPVGDRLMVADSVNNRIMVFNTATITNGMDATFEIGQADDADPFDSADPASGPAGLSTPNGIGYDAGSQHLVVADTANNRVLIYDFSLGAGDGMDANFVLGQQNFIDNASGTTQTTLNFPVGILAESPNSIWVGDSGNNRVLAYDFLAPTGDAATAVLGQPNFTSNTGGGGAAGMTFPVGITVSGTPGSAGALLYVSDTGNNRILVYDYSSGSMVNGQSAFDAYGQTTLTDVGSGTSDTQLSGPSGITYDNVNNALWVGDESNNRVLIFGVAAPPPSPTPGGGGSSPPIQGFTPNSVIIQDGALTADGKNVKVTVRATESSSVAHSGIPVNVVLSNDPNFASYLVFNETSATTNGAGQQLGGGTDWSRTFPWDLCFGLSSCGLGRHTVYARFYVNIPAPSPEIDFIGTSTVPVCKPRPPCLNSSPACAIKVPAGGWCPQVAATLSTKVEVLSVPVQAPASAPVSMEKPDVIRKTLASLAYNQDWCRDDTVSNTTPTIKSLTLNNANNCSGSMTDISIREVGGLGRTIRVGGRPNMLVATPQDYTNSPLQLSTNTVQIIGSTIWNSTYCKDIYGNGVTNVRVYPNGPGAGFINFNTNGVTGNLNNWSSAVLTLTPGGTVPMKASAIIGHGVKPGTSTGRGSCDVAIAEWAVKAPAAPTTVPPPPPPPPPTPTPTPPTPTPLPVPLPLVVTPATQTVPPNVSAVLHASGGVGTYSWYAEGGSPVSGTGANFGTIFTNASTSPITKTVYLTSGLVTTSATVTVSGLTTLSDDINLTNVAGTSWIEINGGAQITDSTVVTLKLQHPFPNNTVGMRIANEPARLAGQPFIPFAQTVSGWNLCGGLPACDGGVKVVYAQFRFGNIIGPVVPVFDSIFYTTTPLPVPHPSVLINNGAAATANQKVTLSLAHGYAGVADGLISMKLANIRTGLQNTSYEPFARGKTWDLCSGFTYCLSGLRSVWGEFTDGLSQGVASDSIDFSNPNPIWGVLINNDAPITSHSAVTLKLNPDFDKPGTTMLVSNDPLLTGAVARPFQATLPWDLCTGLATCLTEQPYTVYVRYLNSAFPGWPDRYEDSILYSLLAPVPDADTGGLLINGGAATTQSRFVTIGLAHPFGVSATNVTLRLATSDTLSPEDRDILAEEKGGIKVDHDDDVFVPVPAPGDGGAGATTAQKNQVPAQSTYRAQPGDFGPVPAGSLQSLEDKTLLVVLVGPDAVGSEVELKGIVPRPITGGEFMNFQPELSNVDICSNARVCPEGVYSFYAQFSHPVQVTSSGTLAALTEEVSYIYMDSIVYTLTPPTPTPTPTCFARPACLDGHPACAIMEPSEGWCPAGTPVTSPAASPTISGGPGATPPGGGGGGGGIGGIIANIIKALQQALAGAGGVIGTISVASAVAVAVSAAIALLSILSSSGGIAFVWQGFMSMLGLLPKRKKVWGTVYDSNTKRPIPFAKVQLLDRNKRVLETHIADKEGRYGFLATPESLQAQNVQISLMPTATGYAFPAHAGASVDTFVYNNLYYGDLITVSDQKLINFDIPMDPLRPSVAPLVMKSPSILLGASVAAIADAGFWLGLIMIPLNVILAPSPFTFGVLFLFLGTASLRIWGIKEHPFGTVIDTSSGRPMPFALITLSDLSGKRIGFTVSDEQGRYFLVADRGTYEMTIFTPATVIPTRQHKQTIEARKGWITRELRV